MTVAVAVGCARVSLGHGWMGMSSAESPPRMQRWTPPGSVAYVQPVDGAVDVPIDLDRITVRFDEDVNPETLMSRSNGCFTDFAGKEQGVNFKVWFDDGVQLQFNSLLQPTETYYVHATTGCTDIAGNPLEEEFISSFTTADAPVDTTPPTVASVTPCDGAVDAPIHRDRRPVR